jgi:hypothetical protein
MASDTSLVSNMGNILRILDGLQPPFQKAPSAKPGAFSGVDKLIRQDRLDCFMSSGLPAEKHGFASTATW